MTGNVLSPGEAMVEDLLRFLPEGMTPNGWAVKAGVNRTVWADIRRHGNPSRKTLEKLLLAAGTSLAEFEALRIGVRTAPESRISVGQLNDRSSADWLGVPLTPLPLIGSKRGENLADCGGQIGTMLFGRRLPGRSLPRPQIVAIDPEAFAIVMTDPSMWPRFRTGRFLIVSPAATIAAGDDVLVRLRDPDGRNLVKQLDAHREDPIRMRQFNPDIEFDLPTDRILSIAKVVGEAY